MERSRREGAQASPQIAVGGPTPGLTVCKTVGLAYVGSNPTPATSVISQDIEDTANLR